MIKTHKAVNGRGVAAEMLTTLDNLKTERVLKKFRTIRALISDINYGRIRYNGFCVLERSTIRISKRRDDFI
jgi:hypothetical protein